MLRSLKIRHFRCFDAFEVEFAPGLNFIVGPNARGKTSLLEAACLLLRLQSPRVTKLGHVVQHGKRGFAVDGYFGARHLQFYFSKTRKKLALDGVEQKVAREYLETARVVYFSNSDIEIVRSTGEVRRRFLDFVGAQREAGYRKALRDYERALRSRNLLLKTVPIRWREVAAFDEPLIVAGSLLTKSRARLVEAIQPHVSAAHHEISGRRESVRVEYLAGSREPFGEVLEAARGEDARLRQTTLGPHRDDLAFRLDEQSSDFASEGQQRTLVLALKLGAARLIAEYFGAPPLLLLDDIFGELDLSRRSAVFQAFPPEAQKLITTTSLHWRSEDAEARILQLE